MKLHSDLNEVIFTFDEEYEQFKAELNGIIFLCDEVNDEHKQYALDLANAYEEKLPDIIEFMLPDIEEFFEVDDVEVIRNSLGVPQIDLNMGMLTYCEHTLDDTHLIDVEFRGVFTEFDLMGIDG